jgi:hypothetical protein
MQNNKIEKPGKVILIRYDGMPGIPLLESQVIKKFLYRISFNGGHKKTGSRKVNEPRLSGRRIYK